MEQLNLIVQALGIDGCDHITIFQQLGQLMKFKRPSYVVLLLILIVILLMMIGLFPRFFSGLLGFIYPAYKTIETIDYRIVEAEKQWLTYWILYCTIMLFDSTLATIFGFLPFFHIFKTIFLVYLYHPSYLGAFKFYEQFISRFYQQYQDQIEKHIDALKSNYNQLY